MRIKTINITAIIFIALLPLAGCLSDETINTKHLVKDFNLSWWSEAKYQALFQNSNNKEYGGAVIIPETVFALGYNEQFIIAKQHPNNDDTISWNNILEHETWILDSIPSDTLGDQHHYVKINGKWHGISNGRDTHPDLFPDKRITIYYIVDIRNYEKGSWSRKANLYKFGSLEKFQEKRKELGVPTNLTFSIINKELE
jgi:hypothetical protein